MGDLVGNPESPNLRRLDKALKNYQLALAILQKVLPPGDIQISMTEGALGECLMAQKRYHEAEPLLRSSYDGVKSKFGEQHQRTVQARQRLAKLYGAWGKPNEAARYR